MCFASFQFLILNIRCVKHGRLCSRKIEIQESHVPDGSIPISTCVAGSACTDFSAYGNMQTSAGHTIIYLLILLRMIAEWKPMIFIHENVLNFPISLLMEILDELYQFEEYLLQPQHAGFPIDRRRKYCIGRLRLKLRRLAANLSWLVCL